MTPPSRTWLRDIGEASAPKAVKRSFSSPLRERGPVTALPNTETYVWPQDRERLEMAFLTGA